MGSSAGTVSRGAMGDEERKSRQEGDGMDEAVSKRSSGEEQEEEDYMELFVAKELKDKIEPILEQLAERQ